MIHDADRLRQLLTKPALRRLTDRLQTRLRLGRRLDGPISFADLSDEERSAIDGLLARPPSSGTAVTVRPQEIQRILVEGKLSDSLEEALIHAFGNIVNERQARDSTRQQWADLRSSTKIAFSDLPEYHGWVDSIFAKGLLKRLCRQDCTLAERFMSVVASVLRGIPWPVVSLADLATRLTGDSHAMDRGTPISRLGLSAIQSQNPLGNTQASRRHLWEWAGVVIDELSAPVLVLNLRADSATLVGRVLNTMADAGEPCHISVRLLRSAGAIAFANMTGKVVYACENPSVVATAAQRLGPACSPLICTAGQPASAAQLLMFHLRQAECRLRYHGDFDYAGIGIANLLIDRFGVEPWRMSAANYTSVRAKGPALRSRCVAPLWDEQLAGSMGSQGYAILEESVLDTLLDDLSQPGWRTELQRPC
jgi:uncharacterized protein (TIGR02679 family)